MRNQSKKTRGFNKNGDKKEKEKEVKDKYSEKKIVRDFLTNKDVGIDFLIEAVKKSKDEIFYNSSLDNIQKTTSYIPITISNVTNLSNTNSKNGNLPDEALESTLTENKINSTPSKRIFSKNEEEIVKGIDNVLDFYATWIKKCPAKKIHSRSIYEGFRIIEKHCEDNEIRNIYNHLFFD